MPDSNLHCRHLLLPRFLFAREDALFANGLLLITLVSTLWLTLDASLDWALLPKADFVSVAGWLFPAADWGSPKFILTARALLWVGAPLWFFGPRSLRIPFAWITVAGILLLGSVYWENLPWFRHKYIPPFWLLLLLALREHAAPDRTTAPAWVREGAVFILAVFYAGSGVAKLLESGFSWADGTAMQLWFWLLSTPGNLLREWVITSAPLSFAVAVVVLGMELLCVLAIPLKRSRIFFGVGLLLLHVGVDQVFYIDFRSHLLLLVVVFLPWTTPVCRLAGRVRKLIQDVDRTSISVGSVRAARGRELSIWVFISGFCGISYEILYGRILGNLVGDQFTVSAALLLAFMLGIGGGALVAHRLWRWLWAVEAAIGLCGGLFVIGTPWIDRLLYSSGASLAFACVVVLLIPSFLIGVSLPLFAGYLQRLVPDVRFSRTYALYNLGAAVTALGIEFWLLRHFGINQATLLIAALNIGVGLVLLLRFRDVSENRPESEIRRLATLPRWSVSALILAGIASAIFQLTLLKIMECLLGPFRETFALVLTTTLIGIAAGSATIRMLRFSFVHVLFLNLAGLAWLLVGVSPVMDVYASLHQEAAASQWGILGLKFAVVAALMLPASAAFGATLPALLGGSRDISRESGKLLFFASIGNAAGFLVMAFQLHRHLDYGAIVLVAGILVVAAILLYSPGLSWPKIAAPIALAVLFVLHRGVWQEKLLYVAYDSFHSTEKLAAARATVDPTLRFKGNQDVFSLTRINGDTFFFINGYISIPLNAPSEKLAAAFPAVFAPRSDRALVLGVGSGATAGTIARLFEHTDTVEINDAILAHLDRMSAVNFDLADNPRARIYHDDGIHFIKAAPSGAEKYSLIINTVTSPRFFSSAKLYTMEFLAAAKSRLADDGIYATYFDTRVGEEGADIMLRTLTSSFRHCAIGAIKSGYFFVLCSDRPIVAHQPRIAEENPEIADYFRRKHKVQAAWIPYGLLLTDATRAIGNPDSPLNTMDRPVLEFAMGRLHDRGYPAFLERLAAAIELDPVRNALRDTMPFSPHNILFHLDGLVGVDSEFVQGWRRVLYALPDFRDTHLKQELALIERTASAAKYPATIFFAYAGNLKDRNDLHEAIAAYRRALAIQPNYNDAHFHIGAVYEKLGAYDEAIQSYEQEKVVDPNEDASDFCIGRVLLTQGRPLEAIPRLEIAHRQRPNDQEIVSLLGQSHALAEAIANLSSP